MIALGLTAFALIALGWGLYPLILTLMPARPLAATAVGERPRVSVVIATREAVEVVVARVDDIWTTSYPHDRLEVVVGVDVHAAAPWTAYRDALGSRARVVAGDAEGGKPANLNAAVRAAAGELLVLTDSGQRFEAATIPALVSALADPAAGAASGLLRLEDERGGVIDLFWRFELLLRTLESSRDSLVAVTGACYAMRAALWRPLPAGLICDDLLIPLTVRRLGARVVHAPAARATDPRRFTPAQESRRKIRTLTGMLQVMAWAPWVLVPGRNPIFFQFLCHKLLRLATPYLLVGGLAALALALPGEAWRVALIALLIVAPFVLLALVLRPRLRAQLVIAARLFVAPVLATSHAMRGDWDVWRPTRG